ncbi:hypothetical protein L902_11335 [Agrobacterium radiobacter DSM 30147]|nr:hypothetical protein L902_11335 [Agrobacterium radiobacter DSM 30147]
MIHHAGAAPSAPAFLFDGSDGKVRDDLRKRGICAEFYSRNIADIELSSLYRFNRKS